MSRQHPWRAENPDAVIVARPSKWGNPFAVGDDLGNGNHVVDREHAVNLFTNWLTNSLHDGRYVSGLTTYGGVPAASRPSIEDIRNELGHKDLACWCPPGQSCHADVLMNIANAPG